MRRLSPMLGVVCTMLIALATFMVAMPSTGHARDIVAYRVQPGDSLSQLAKDYFVRQSYAENVRRINKIKNPRKIPVGKVIYIPKPYLRFTELEARVQTYRGKVVMSRRNSSGIRNVSKGMTLREGDIVSTASAGYVTLAIEGGARASLPSKSTVRIDRLRKYHINNEVERIFSLKNGRTDVEADSLGKGRGSKTLQIRGPNATAAIRGTGFSVSAHPQFTGISVFHGTVAAAEPSGKDLITEPTDVGTIDGLEEQDEQFVSLPKGFGAAGTEEGLGDAIKLLDPPVQSAPRKLYREPNVDFPLVPLSGAKSYRFRVATDAAMIDVVDEKDTVAPEASFDTLPDGHYFIKVSGIDKYGLEGMSRTYAFHRIYSTIEAAPAEANGGNVKFAWTAAGQGGSARFVLADNEALVMPMVDRAGLNGGQITLKDLPPGTYYWSVERRLVLDGEPITITSGARELVVADQ